MKKHPYLFSFDKKGKVDEGFLVVASVAEELPFELARSFWTVNTPKEVTRGRHAHKKTEMVIVALKGAIQIRSECVDGRKFHHVLESPFEGLYVPPFCWHEMDYVEDTIQLVLASTLYEEEDYIRDYDAFKSLIP